MISVEVWRAQVLGFMKTAQDALIINQMPHVYCLYSFLNAAYPEEQLRPQSISRVSESHQRQLPYHAPFPGGRLHSPASPLSGSGHSCAPTSWHPDCSLSAHFWRCGEEWWQGSIAGPSDGSSACWKAWRSPFLWEVVKRGRESDGDKICLIGFSKMSLEPEEMIPKVRLRLKCCQIIKPISK